MTRADELAANLTGIRARIDRACRAAGRGDDIGLVVVTKFFPATDVRILADLGVVDVGENRHQEAEAKAAQTADLPLRWHFIGGLQSNKATAVARYAHVVESVDRPSLVPRLDRGAGESGRTVEILLQVSLDPSGAVHRAGADPDDLPALGDAVVAAEHLELCGLMAVAPLGEEPVDAFARLAVIRARFLEQFPTATRLSAGMSGDLEAAIAAGATHVRVGSAVLGSRV